MANERNRARVKAWSAVDGFELEARQSRVLHFAKFMNSFFITLKRFLSACHVRIRERTVVVPTEARSCLLVIAPTKPPVQH